MGKFWHSTNLWRSTEMSRACIFKSRNHQESINKYLILKNVVKNECDLEVEENIENYEIPVDHNLLKNVNNLCKEQNMDIDGNMSCMLLGMDIFLNSFKDMISIKN